MMKFSLILIIAITIANQVTAQVPEDAVRMSWSAPSGTARSQAIGGAIGSLGGDITSTFVNPAGIGVYKTREFVFTPGISIIGGNSSFRGNTETATTDSKFNLGITGFVFGKSNPQSKWNSNAFSIAINRTANFNSNIFYRGNNDFSSFSESFAEEFANSHLPINTVLYSAPLSYGTKLANYTYLIDTLTTNGTTQIVGLPLRDATMNGTDAVLLQQKRVTSKGGITEIALSYAGNMDDKLYVGGSIGIPVVNYERTSVLSEFDESGNTNNNFDNAVYSENYEASGFGINAKLGMIVKPGNSFRGGLAVHTPTIYTLRETTTGFIETDLENYLTGGRTAFANEDSIYGQFGYNVPQYRYDYYSPWKFILSGSYIFSGVEDVSQQKGFVTADVEYVTHGSSRFHAADENGDEDYYNGVNEGVKLSYKGAFNFKVGAEMKFNIAMARLGFSYYGSPYEDSQLKAHKMNVSGGFGYRNKGFFVDVTYVQSLNKDADFPYRLSDKANTYAEVRDRTGMLLMTFGVKF
jgi:hypothetical protein